MQNLHLDRKVLEFKIKIIYFEFQSAFANMNVPKMLKSFIYALNGVRNLFAYENNAKFHLIATVLVLLFGFWLQVSMLEWCILTLCITAVLSFEAINTGIEKLCDKINNEHDETIGAVKDLSAAGVLFAAVGSALVAFIIFLPKLLKMI